MDLLSLTPKNLSWRRLASDAVGPLNSSPSLPGSNFLRSLLWHRNRQGSEWQVRWPCGNGLHHIQLRDYGRRTIQCLQASNSDPSQDVQESKLTAVSEEGDTVESSPPILTILAGIFVFLLFLWVLGSLVVWILGWFIR